MDAHLKKRLTKLTIVYWVLLLYIIAALVWWFISLSRQNAIMTDLKMSELKADDPAYYEKVLTIQEAKKRKDAQYIGEGSIFMLLIIVGAVFVFRATRRQFKLAQMQQSFMMAITHELKTPIAIARLNLETLQKRKLDEAQQRRLVGSTLEEAERLNDLCNNILLTSQFESGANRFTKEELELGALANDCVQQFRRRFAARQIDFETTEETAVYGEPLLLQLLVNNLIENALKYSPKNHPVMVEVKREKGKVLLQVKDQGPGIPVTEQEKIFDKFYRIGDERTRTSKGTGLGLYLCKKIMDDHRGSIQVSDNQPAGSIFTATFSGR
ncbi:MAG: ATP-binding protein [Chitinophagaceae bacterium]